MNAANSKCHAVCRARAAEVAVVFALGALLLPSAAWADVAECVAAHAHGQAERNAGRLQSAKADFTSCSAAGCPSEIQNDCVSFLAELEVYLPSVVFAALDADGGDAIDVKVEVDGKLLLEKLTGLATTLDPGSHEVVYRWPDGFVQRERVVIAQGEKNRRIELRREPRQLEAPPPAPAKPAAGKPPAIAYVLGGVGALALGSFATFAILGKSAESDMDGCKPYCTQAQADKMRLHYLVADISLGVGLVSLGVGGVLYFQASRQPGGTALRSGTVGWGGRF